MTLALAIFCSSTDLHGGRQDVSDDLMLLRGLFKSFGAYNLLKVAYLDSFMS